LFVAWYRTQVLEIYQKEMKEYHIKKKILNRLKNRLTVIEFNVLHEAFKDTFGQ